MLTREQASEWRRAVRNTTCKDALSNQMTTDPMAAQRLAVLASAIGAALHTSPIPNLFPADFDPEAAAVAALLAGMARSN